MNYYALDEALAYLDGKISESFSVNYNKIKQVEYEEASEEVFKACIDKFKKRIANITNDIADQIYDKIEDYLDEDDPLYKQYNSVSKIKSKLKVELVQFRKAYRDPYEGEFIIYLYLGSEVFGDQTIVSYVNICKDGQQTIFHKDYEVDVQIED